jgi:transcriptional regulator with XRE-family HTH domain
MSISFSDVVRRGRERAGLSQARVAQLIGKSASTVRAWEQGRTNPGDAQSVSTLAAVLGLDETELLDRAGFDTPVTTPVPKSAREELSTLAAERTEMIAIKPGGIVVPDQRGPRHLHDGEATTAEPLELEPTIEPVVEVIVEPTITRARKVTAVQSVPIQSAGSNAVSYLEDSEQRDFYRRRAVTTAVVLVFLLVVFWWALGRAGGAFNDFVASFLDELNF